MSLSQTDHANGDNGEQQTDREVAAAELLEVLDAKYTQSILESLRGGPKSARELAEECGASRPTVYRRMNSLQDVELVETDTVINVDGHHRTVFETTVERFSVELTETGLSVRIHHSGEPGISHPDPHSLD